MNKLIQRLIFWPMALLPLAACQNDLPEPPASGSASAEETITVPVTLTVGGGTPLVRDLPPGMEQDLVRDDQCDVDRVRLIIFRRDETLESEETAPFVYHQEDNQVTNDYNQTFNEIVLEWDQKSKDENGNGNVFHYELTKKKGYQYKIIALGYNEAYSSVSNYYAAGRNEKTLFNLNLEDGVTTPQTLALTLDTKNQQGETFFNSLGTEVHVVEMTGKILGPMDRELSEMLQAEYAKRGVKFYLESKVISVDNGTVSVEKDGEIFALPAEKILLSAGRVPMTIGFGLENLQLEMRGRGVRTDGYMQTSCPGVYACGDITGFSLLAHTAVSEAEVAVEHILGGTRLMSYRAIPGVVYTNPEFAGVGKTEEELQKEGLPYQVKKVPMSFSGRFVAENEMGSGVCKLLLDNESRLIGAHILGNPASELIVIAGIAIEKGMKAGEFRSFVFPHPTVGEILREAY